jgi:pyruvate kinase
MRTIAANAEEHLPQNRWTLLETRRADAEPHELATAAISQATVEVALAVGAAAIVTSTMSGTTARMVARHRPSMPVIAATPDARTLHRLALVWGVQPVLVGGFKHTDEMIQLTVEAACRLGVVSRGDVIVITAGIPFGGKGKTNFLKVHTLGEFQEL